MKLSILLSLLATCTLLPVPACSHVQQTAEDCAKQATPDLVHRVDTVLAGENYDTALTAIESEVALCVLRAAVVAVEKLERTDTAALSAHDPMATAKVSHAQAWLAAHGGAPVTTTTVKAGLPGGGGPKCCHHVGTGAPWVPGERSTVNSQTCGPFALVTAGNLGVLCSSNCLPNAGSCP